MSDSERQIMNRKPVHWAPAKAVLNLQSGFREKLLCDGMTFTMGSACVYRCSFCYVPDMMRKQKTWQDILKADPATKFEDVVIRRSHGTQILRSQLLDAKGRKRFDGPEQVGRVVYASPLVDVAGNMDLATETADACLLILELTRWNIRLLSKSNLLPKIALMLDEHARQWNPRTRVIYGVSTGTLDDRLAAAFEEETPLVRQRLKSLHFLQDNGFRTFGMLCPSLPLPGEDYKTMAHEMNASIRANRCEHVWAEVMNVRGNSMTRTIEELSRAGYGNHAEALTRVTEDPLAWEDYARKTFDAHVSAIYLPGQLRFLQYVNNANREWWKARVPDGAILL